MLVYKITDYAALTGAAADTAADVLEIIDVSDTTMDPTGTNKKITLDEIEAAITKAGLDLPVVAASAPAAGFTRLFAKSSGGRAMPAFIGPSGVDSKLQPHLGANRMRQWVPLCGSTTALVYGCTAPTATGTATAATKATTNLHQFVERVDYLVTTAATTAVAGFRTSSGTAAGLSIYRGNAAKIGGFHYVVRWGPATGVTTSTRRAFVGLQASTAAPTDVQPSSLLNIIGMGWDAADTNVQIMHNDGTGTATKVDCGFARASADRTSIYELELFAAPNASSVGWKVTELATDSTASGTITTDLVANTTAIYPIGYASVGGTSSVVGISLMGMYVETDY